MQGIASLARALPDGKVRVQGLLIERLNTLVVDT